MEAGTVLKGLGFIKGKEAPLAKDDSEYPEWLWGLLDKDKLKDEQNEKGEADMFCKYFGRHGIRSFLPFPPLFQSRLDTSSKKKHQEQKLSGLWDSIHFISYFTTKTLTFPPFRPAKSKKQRRLAAKRARKAGIDPASLIPKTPIQAQTVDLPHGDGSGGDRDIEAQKAREEVKAAMRKARKKQIKERNFLITMK